MTAGIVPSCSYIYSLKDVHQWIWIECSVVHVSTENRLRFMLTTTGVCNVTVNIQLHAKVSVRPNECIIVSDLKSLNLVPISSWCKLSNAQWRALSVNDLKAIMFNDVGEQEGSGKRTVWKRTILQTHAPIQDVSVPAQTRLNMNHTGEHRNGTDPLLDHVHVYLHA